MKGKDLAVAWILGAVVSGEAIGQKADVPSSAHEAEMQAELEAGISEQMRAEMLLSAGGPRGPDSEACTLMTRALVRHVRAAAKAGAETRLLDWRELSPGEKEAVKGALSGKTAGPLERTERMREHACWRKQ